MVSAMQIHRVPAYRLIRDAWQLGDDRPLILAGGPKAVYEPLGVFRTFARRPRRGRCGRHR